MNYKNVTDHYHHSSPYRKFGIFFRALFIRKHTNGESEREKNNIIQCTNYVELRLKKKSNILELERTLITAETH